MTPPLDGTINKVDDDIINTVDNDSIVGLLWRSSPLMSGVGELDVGG